MVCGNVCYNRGLSYPHLFSFHNRRLDFDFILNNTNIILYERTSFKLVRNLTKHRQTKAEIRLDSLDMVEM